MQEGTSGRYVHGNEVGIFIARIPANRSAKQILQIGDWKILLEKSHKEFEKYNRIVYMEHSGDLFMTNEKYWRFHTDQAERKTIQATGTFRRFLRNPGRIDEASGMTLF